MNHIFTWVVMCHDLTQNSMNFNYVINAIKDTKKVNVKHLNSNNKCINLLVHDKELLKNTLKYGCD